MTRDTPVTEPRDTDPTSARRIDRAELVDAYGLDEALVDRAKAREHETLRLAVSGKIAAGKDTVAPAALTAAGAHDSVSVAFAKPLKDELSEIISVTAAAASLPQASRWVAERFAIPAGQARALVSMLWPSVRLHSSVERGCPVARVRWAAAVGWRRTSPPRAVAAAVKACREPSRPLTGWSRTAEVREALQYLGTDIRRAQDELHWVRRHLELALTEIAAGRSVRVTDPRFPNELRALRCAGFVTVRLDVDEATQRERLRQRDGVDPDPQRFLHPSETALDDFEGFDLRLRNDDMDLTVRRVAELLSPPQ